MNIKFKAICIFREFVRKQQLKHVKILLSETFCEILSKVFAIAKRSFTPPMFDGTKSMQNMKSFSKCIEGTIAGTHLKLRDKWQQFVFFAHHNLEGFSSITIFSLSSFRMVHIRFHSNFGNQDIVLRTMKPTPNGECSQNMVSIIWWHTHTDIYRAKSDRFEQLGY